MNSLIRDEVLLILNVFGEYKEKEQISIVSVCSKMLDCDKYVSKIKLALDEICKEPSFDITTDFINLIVRIINENRNVEFYKELDQKRMKICIYCMLYNYLINNDNNENLNKLEIQKFRILYFNTVKVLLLAPDEVIVPKESLTSKIGRFLHIACLIGEKILVK